MTFGEFTFFSHLLMDPDFTSRKHGFKCNTVAISIRDNSLYHFSRQMHLREPTDITDEIMNAVMELLQYRDFILAQGDSGWQCHGRT